MLIVLAQTQGIGMPDPVSTFAPEVDWLWNFITIVSIFFTVLNLGLMAYFVCRYRQKDRDDLPHGQHHNTTLEITWSVIPLIIVLAIFVWGFRGYLSMATPPANSLEFMATTWKWAWEFTYPNGFKTNELHVPADKPIQVVLESRDVIHAFYVPEFRTKRDIVPGRYNKIWFQVDSEPNGVAFNGTIDTELLPDGSKKYTDHGAKKYRLYCAEYCGTNHSKMQAYVYIHTQEGYNAWLAAASDWQEGLPPVQVGQKLYSLKGCNTCHSLDGSRGNGPSWKNLFGYPQMLKSGDSKVADEAFIRQAILEPNSQGIVGYQPVMPKLNLKESDVSALIAFIKSQSDKGPYPQTSPALKNDAEQSQEPPTQNQKQLYD